MAAGFGDITTDNRHIITMEQIVEGLALISTAMFVTVAAAIQPEAAVSSAVYAVAIVTLVVPAVVSLFTGFKVAFLPFKLCPFIFVVSAGLIAWGGLLGMTLPMSRPDRFSALLVMNTMLGTGYFPLSEGFLAWRAESFFNVATEIDNQIILWMRIMIMG